MDICRLLEGFEEVGESLGRVFVLVRFLGLPLLIRVFCLRPSRSADFGPLNRVLLLVVSAHDPSIDSTSSDGITSSGSGDLFPPLFDLRGGVEVRGI